MGFSVVATIAFVSSLSLIVSPLPVIYDIGWYYEQFYQLCNNVSLPSMMMWILPSPYTVNTVLSKSSSPSPSSRSIRTIDSKSKDTVSSSVGSIPSIVPFLVMLIDNYIGLTFSFLIKDKLGLGLRVLGTGLNILYIVTLIHRLTTRSFPQPSQRGIATDHRYMYHDIVQKGTQYLPLFYGILAHIVTGIVLYTVYDKTNVPKQIHSLGLLNTLTSIGFAISPLLQLPAIIREKNANTLSLPMSVALAFCALSWTVRGIQLRQTWMILPNALNAMLAVGQLYLIYSYRSNGNGNRNSTVKTSSQEFGITGNTENMRNFSTLPVNTGSSTTTTTTDTATVRRYPTGSSVHSTLREENRSKKYKTSLIR